MRPPRFRLRTLMIAVTVAALECWLLVRDPSVGIILLGPLIGSPLMGFLSRNRPNGLLVGGIAGGLVETGMFVIFPESVDKFSALVTAPTRDFYLPWPYANVGAGFLVGMTFGVLHILRSAIVSPASIVDNSEVRVTAAPEETGWSREHRGS